MENKDNNEKKLKKILDNLLIFNLFIIIIGAIFFIVSVFLSINGNSILYDLFQRLWYPVFIPALSLFFTAILVEAIFSNIGNRNI